MLLLKFFFINIERGHSFTEYAVCTVLEIFEPIPRKYIALLLWHNPLPLLVHTINECPLKETGDQVQRGVVPRGAMTSVPKKFKKAFR